jgi:hypothetical protein
MEFGKHRRGMQNNTFFGDFEFEPIFIIKGHHHNRASSRLISLSHFDGLADLISGQERDTHNMILITVVLKGHAERSNFYFFAHGAIK